jgi:dihydroorotase
MNVLIKQATIVDSKSPFHNKTVDILIEKGVITQIKSKIVPTKNSKIIEVKDLFVSAGWIDMQANFCDPGNEHKETLQTGLAAAAKGGFTGVCVMSGTNPPLHDKSQIEYIKSRALNNIVDVFPIGTVSHQQEGKDLSEMYDMKLAGAVAFSDYKKPIKDAGLILRALQYASSIDSFIIAHCDDKTISQEGQMNEGVSSTKLGLKGIPALAEELMLQRNLQIVEYTGGRLHIPTISTKGSVELIKKAKANGLHVTAGVAAHNLVLDETSLEGFDTHFKVNPPLRSKDDVIALRKALENGIIDVVVSDHAPQDTESKDLEFDLAENGMIASQTAFNCLVSSHSKITSQKIADVLAENPRTILGIKEQEVAENRLANLTLFTLTNHTIFSEKDNASKSNNSPFFGKSLQGKVIACINHGMMSAY